MRRRNSAPSLAALRMRRYRKRQRAGLKSVIVRIRESEISTLVRRGLLHDEMRNDIAAIAKALHSLLDRALV
jgi:hypothetical protein